MQFSDIRLIVITHAHIDHAGNTAKIQSLSGAKVIGHTGDLAYYQGCKKMHFCSTGWFGRLFSKTGAIQKPYQHFTPDLLLSENERYNLNSYGINSAIISTPGHTAGSISVIVDDDNAIVGDLISSGILLGGIMRKHKAKRPPFEDKPLQVSHELLRIADSGVNTFYMGHGGPLIKQEVVRHIEKLKSIPIS